jgi:hypothetical protein
MIKSGPYYREKIYCDQKHFFPCLAQPTFPFRHFHFAIDTPSVCCVYLIHEIITPLDTIFPTTRWSAARRQSSAAVGNAGVGRQLCVNCIVHVYGVEIDFSPDLAAGPFIVSYLPSSPF